MTQEVRLNNILLPHYNNCTASFLLNPQGPNWLWAVDGHEKLAQPYGLYLYGIIDTYSRKVLSLKVLPNKKADTIMEWMTDVLHRLGGRYCSLY